MITINDITIKIKLLKHPHILAQTTVIIGDVWEEHGWKVLKSNRPHPNFQDFIWIQAPSYRQKNEKGEIVWREITYITDPDLWQRVQEEIYGHYHMARTRDDGQNGLKESKTKITKDETEEINIDDIPENLGEEDRNLS